MSRLRPLRQLQQLVDLLMLQWQMCSIVPPAREDRQSPPRFSIR